MRKKIESDVITIYDVAKKAGVSLATVSRVMNKSAKVKPEKVARVEEAIKELNYKPNMIARGLASKTTTTVGLLVVDTERLSNFSVASGIVDVANMKEYNYSVKLNSYQGDESRIEEAWTDMLSKQVDGILFMCDVMTPQIEKMIQESNVNVVLINTYTASKTIPSVRLDYEQIFQDIFTEEADIVASEILYVSRQKEIEGGEFLRDLFATVAEKQKKAIKKNQIVVLDGQYAEAHAYFTEYFKTNKKQFIVCESDTVAAACINAAIDAKLSIPEDIQVFSLMMTKLTEVIRPSVSGVNYPYYKVGAVAMRLLTKFMKKEELSSNQYVVDYVIDWNETTR
ncbi:MAG: LacI family DNA-binding transcriptional regulator [Culicoidibacterales bacterium]